MKTAFKATILALFVLLLTACGGGEPTLDTSSDEAMEQSYGEMTADLSEEEHQKFDEALGTVYMMGALRHMESGKSEDEVLAQINESVHGKTVAEIRAMGDDMEDEIERQLQGLQQ